MFYSVAFIILKMLKCASEREEERLIQRFKFIPLIKRNFLIYLEHF